MLVEDDIPRKNIKKTSQSIKQEDISVSKQSAGILGGGPAGAGLGGAAARALGEMLLIHRCAPLLSSMDGR
jgi:hypothetical protein